MQTAAIYVRVSTDADGQKDSPANQVATCQEYAASIGLTVPDSLIYNDAGTSGTKMTNRPEVARMLVDARTGQFEAVLFTAISRFSRDLSDALGTRKRLESVYGIRLISIEEGYDSDIEGRNSEMIFTVHAMLAAHKSQEMSKAIQRGLRQSARRGRHTGNLTPFGYVKTADKKLVPDPLSASIVREIFSLYLTGMGAKAIAQVLNARGVPTASKLRHRRDTLWQASTVNAMLHNEVYIGTITAHKRTRQQDIEQSRRTDTNVKRLRLRPQEQWVVISDAHEALIDKQIFDQARAQLSLKAHNKGIRRNANLLAGHMVCASCAGNMMVTASGASTSNQVYKYVVCSKVKRIGKSACDNQSRTKYADLEHTILEQLTAFAPNTHLENAAESLLPSVENGRNTVRLRLDSLDAALQKNAQAQKSTLEAFHTGLFPRSIVEAHQRELLVEATQLENERDGLRAEAQDVDVYGDRLEEIASKLNIFSHVHLYDEIARRMAMQTVLDRILIHPDGHIDVFWAWSE